MENIHKEFLESLIEIEKLWKSADHIVYVTLPVVKDPKLLLVALNDLHIFMIKSISLILKFEYFYKRVILYEDSKKNLEEFFRKCAGKYGLNGEDIESIREIIMLGKKHKESGFEIAKDNRVLIFDDEYGKSELNKEKLKNFIAVGRKILENTNKNLKSFF